MNGAEALVEMLLGYDIQVIFGVPGDTSVDFYDALHAKSERITHLMARDERSAAFMADVYARLSNKPGICEGPSGGGATYILPGVVEAHGSSVALLALTSDNPTTYEAQGALTDLNQPQVFAAATKWTTRIQKAEMLPHMVRRAFRLATSGRPGSVHLSLPKDVLAAEMRADADLHIEDACKVWPAHRTRPDAATVDRAARVLLDAARPVIVAGGGAIFSGAEAELLALARFLGTPVATTINGKGAIAETEPLSLGVIGANGGRPYAAEVVQEADLVLFVGCKINYVDTDNWRLPDLASPPQIVQIDVDPSELGNNYPIDEGLCGDAKAALTDLLAAVQDLEQSPIDRAGWLDKVTRQKASWRAQVKAAAASAQLPIVPQRVVHELRAVAPDEAVFVCDPGTPTPFMAAEFELDRSGKWVISPRAQGGLGYAIPGVVGARLARPNAPIVGLCGDGSFSMSAGDLATIARVGGPTVLILFNNRCFGWIKTLQHFYHGARYFSVDFTEQLDYVRIAEGFGLRAWRVEQPDRITRALQEALHYGGPCMIEIVTAPEHHVVPPVAAWQRAVEQGAPAG